MGSWDSSGWCDTGPGRAPPKRQEERGIAAQQRARGGNEPGGAGEARHLGGDAGEAGARTRGRLELVFSAVNEVLKQLTLADSETLTVGWVGGRIICFFFF